ncbi:MAG TPA: mechanosensitive ion channel family protein [Chitinophagaceae bacterium]|nr:mechanosensitive ion channel family protein [Chitinophagaceae bacterium]
MNSFFDYTFLGNTVKDWSICIGIIVASILVARLFRSVVIKKLQKLTQKTSTDFDDFIVSVIRRFAMPLINVLCIYFGLKYLSLPGNASRVLSVAVTVVSVFFVVRAINAFIRYFFYSYLNRESPEEEKKKQVRGILILINAVVWVIGIVFLIDNLGYDITTIVTGLGIGGIAIALASQAILGDLFSYLVIFFDKPFEIGDFIIVDDKIGVVEYIGIKTTRIKTLSGEQLICSNTDLTNSRVHNFKRMEQRRVLFSFGVVYGTPAAKLKRIPGMVKEIIEKQKLTRFDRAHFFSFGDYSLNFEIVYYVHSADYNIYMDTQQAINLAIFERFENENIEFAFPTQTLFFQRSNMEAVNN